MRPEEQFGREKTSTRSLRIGESRRKNTYTQNHSHFAEYIPTKNDDRRSDATIISIYGV